MKIHEIEKNISIPELRAEFKYPWSRMEIGDSVFIEPENGKTIYDIKRTIDSAAQYFAKRTGKKLSALLDHDNNGVRVWRIG